MLTFKLSLIYFLTLLFPLIDVVNFNNSYGAGANPTGDPIGGGSGYSEIYSTGNYEVSTKEELLSALMQASGGDVIYVTPESNINLSDQTMLEIPQNVTLAGNRGFEDSSGPLIFSNSMSDGHLFKVKSGVRITGIRFKGPDVDFSDITYPLSPFVKGSDEQSNAKCISVNGTDVQIDNCEISNFHRVGIDVQKGTTRLNIHHNFLHDIHAYPILVVSRTSMPIIIEANIIHWIWHATAGTGAPGTGYEARYNIFIAKPLPPNWYSEGSHAIDMHPDNDIEDARGHLVAGDNLEIHHNTFIDESGTHPSIENLEDAKIRGVPRILAKFYNNIFQNSDPAKAIAHNGDPGNIWVFNNMYGQSPIDISMESTPQIKFNYPPPLNRELPSLSSNNFTIDITVNVKEPLSLVSVQLELDGEEIYSAPSAPIPGSLILQSADFNDSLNTHTLQVRATDNRGVTATHITDFKLSAILPVTITTFDCFLDNQMVTLNWVTSSEINCEYFEVLRSADGLTWNKIAKIQASGNGHSEQEYETLDLKPQKGENYYKLKIVDYDGFTDYSNIKFIFFENNQPDVIIYPSLSNHIINIKANEKLLNRRYYLINTSGQILMSKYLIDTDCQIDIQNLASDIYFIVFTGNNSKIVKKFMKIN